VPRDKLKFARIQIKQQTKQVTSSFIQLTILQSTNFLLQIIMLYIFELLKSFLNLFFVFLFYFESTIRLWAALPNSVMM